MAPRTDEAFVAVRSLCFLLGEEIKDWVDRGFATEGVFIRTIDGEALLTEDHIMRACSALRGDDIESMRQAILPLVRIADYYRDGRVRTVEAETDEDDVLAVNDEGIPMIRVSDVEKAYQYRDAV